MTFFRRRFVEPCVVKGALFRHTAVRSVHSGSKVNQFFFFLQTPHYWRLFSVLAGQVFQKKGVGRGVVRAMTTKVENPEDPLPTRWVMEVMRRRAEELRLQPDTEMNTISVTDVSVPSRCLRLCQNHFCCVVMFAL